MNLARPLVWSLVAIYVAGFVAFAIVAQFAFVSGSTFEYRMYGVQFPYIAFALLSCMTVSSGLLYTNYRGEDFRSAERLIYGSLLGVSAFGMMLSAILVLSLVTLG